MATTGKFQVVVTAAPTAQQVEHVHALLQHAAVYKASIADVPSADRMEYAAEVLADLNVALRGEHVAETTANVVARAVNLVGGKARTIRA